MGRKKGNCFQMVDIPKRVVEVFSFFLLFWFWFLVFGLWFLTVALLAWRVVFLFGWGLGLGLGLYTTQGKFALDWTTYRYMLPFFY